MTQHANSDTRSRLLKAAADMIAHAPGKDVSLRAVCERVGVKMPTLYHYFGNKQALLSAVVEHGFELYINQKRAAEPTGDPLADIRAGWHEHVRFGLENPGFYVLMYGTAVPGYAPYAHAEPTRMLLKLTQLAESQGRLVVPSEQAAEHVLVANIGVTLHQIGTQTPDQALSDAMCEAAIAAITGTALAVADAAERVPSERELYEYAAAHPEVLGIAETQLFQVWLDRLTTNMAANALQ